VEIDMLTKEQKTMIKLWEDGKTGLQIAEKLGKTRNAVMGALKRLRDNGHIEYKQIPVKRGEKRPPPNLEPKILVSSEAAFLKKPPVKFVDLTHNSCRFIINDSLPKDFLFCNDDKKKGSPYCERHHKMCYVPGTSEIDRNKKRKRLTYDLTTKPAYTH